ncbi:MAG: acetyl-CoA carboxylase biotin carboxyl carrier protein [Terriglobia bacterium]
MSYDQIADLIKIVDASACEELVLETTELKLILRRNSAALAPTVASPRPASSSDQGGKTASVHPETRPRRSLPPVPETRSEGEIAVRSPMVGTFYRSSAPDVPPFVDVGADIMPGQPLCMIEVMKLLTTIFAETEGRVLQVCADDGELVEYGRTLFVIAKAQQALAGPTVP